MIDPQIPLRQRLAVATGAALGDEAAGADPALHRSDHADYQADLALALARRLKRNPREVAAAIVAQLAPDEVIEAAVVSGPGFINLTLRPEYLGGELTRMRGDPRLGVELAAAPELVVVDYSAPNAAKEMHVGHLRSTVIGEAVVRLLELQGHTVLRQNHLGDWGTPFGMLVEHLLDTQSAGADVTVTDLVPFYQAARAKFDSDPAFADRARRRVVLLQGGDETTSNLWRRLIELSIEHFDAMYTRMGISLRREHVAGESQYNDALAEVVAELERKGLARESEGAICVFPPGFTGREGEPAPLIIRKSDGGYGYATTDLAALRHRMLELGARRVVYVVGAPQMQHLAMVFATGRLAGWVPETARLEHVAFGSILGPDKKAFKTRTGDTVALASLLDEAVERAAKVVQEKSPNLDDAAKSGIAEAVGIGAIKYADLANDRIKDYVFDWNRMLSFDGNTAPYLMYAHARIRSILNKAGLGEEEASAPIRIDAPQERALALELLQFATTIDRTAETLQPHRLATLLYQTATTFMSFYEHCPVLKADEPARGSRLALCQLTARTLSLGLDILGITAPEQM